MAASFFDWWFGGDEGIKENANLSIDDAVALASTGGILLFRGWSPTSTFIQIFTASTWSHIALVVRLPTMNEGKPMVFESIHSDDDHVDGKNFVKLVDLKYKVPRVGVRLVDMKQYLESIVGENVAMFRKNRSKQIKVVLRVLTVPPLPGIYEAMYDHLNEVARGFVEEHAGKPYECRWYEMLQARFQFGDTTGLLTPDSLFCSELVAMFLLKAGLFDINFDTPNMLLPDDFSDANRLTLRYPTHILPVLKGQFENPDSVVKFSREMIIDTVTPLPEKPVKLRILNYRF